MDNTKKHLPPDSQLFRDAMKGVSPLKTQPRADPAKVRTATRKSTTDHTDTCSEDNSDILCETLPGIDSEHGTSHRKNGVQKSILQKLKRGRFKPGDQMDLHQMTVETATAALLNFIADSQSRSLKSIRVIHGKGLHSQQGPKLKLMTRQLLRNHPKVLAFTACKPPDGGDGATDVLLNT